MAITTEEIKKLRDETGVSIMQCKKALEEADGDLEKARVVLRKYSKAAADKKADRELGAGAIASYIHGAGKVGAMVQLMSETDFVSNNEAFQTLARDIALHIAGAGSLYISRDEVPAEALEKVTEVFMGEIEADKPEEIREKILEGKLGAYFAESVLLEQPFVKDPEKTIQILLDEATQKFGERVSVAKFVRYSM
jgi:elongation factor Ts